MTEYINKYTSSSLSPELRTLVTHHNQGISLRKDILANCELLTTEQMKLAVRGKFPKLHSYFLDTQYRVAQENTILRAVEYTQTKRFKYTAETFDCDDFATVFKSELVQLGTNAVAIVIDTSGKHAYSAVMVKNIHGMSSLIVIEPQTDKRVVIGTGHYKATEGYIIF